MNYKKQADYLIIAGIAIGFIIWAALFIYRSSFIAIDGQRYFSLFDDAMISMRYAWNLSHGIGLVWNPGKWVEGYTNLLMVLWMSFVTLIFDNKSIAVLAIQISGIIFMLGNAYLAMRIAEHISLGESQQHRILLRLITFFCVLSYYPLVYWSLMGMETGLLTFLLLLAILFVLKNAHEYKQNRLLLPIILGLAYLTRPESLVPAVIILTYFYYSKRQKSLPVSHAFILGIVTLYLMFPLGKTLFSWLYYGELFPNTYTLKIVGMPLWHRIQNGLGFIMPFLSANILMMLLVMLGLVVNFRPQKLLLVAIASAVICYQIWAGGDPWPYWRILSPVMPLILILFVHEILLIVAAFSKTAFFQHYFLQNPIIHKAYIPIFLVFLIILSGLIQTNLPFLGQIVFLIKPYQTLANQTNVNDAIILDRLTSAEATLGVFWAGSIPYYTGRISIDFLGKNDKYIARLNPDLSEPAWHGMRGVPGHNKYDLNYSIKLKQPTYVQTFGWGKFAWGQQDISAWAKNQYVEVKYKGIRLFFHKDSQAVRLDELKRSNEN